MAGQTVQSTAAAAWRAARAQHWVVTRRQLLALGFNRRAIEHRIATGRLHPVHRGVYAVGRPQLSRAGEFMAAVLACGEGAALSHESAAELWRIRPRRPGDGEVSVPGSRRGRRPGLTVHRRRGFETVRRDGVPVTTPVTTIVDITPRLTSDELAVAINQADYHGLTTPQRLWLALPTMAGAPGVAAVRELLERHAYVVTDTELEVLFVPIARHAGLPPPLTQVWLNAARVDFYWPELGLVVETDGGLAHRSPLQQTKDRRRDQAHAVAGLTVLRFTRAQVKFEPRHVEEVLRTVAQRLAA
jgi:hypothetical protein